MEIFSGLFTLFTTLYLFFPIFQLDLSGKVFVFFYASVNLNWKYFIIPDI